MTSAATFFTPTGIVSARQYVYHHGTEVGERVIQYDMVQLNTHPEIYAVIFGQGGLKSNPTVEIYNMHTTGRVRTPVDKVHLICHQKNKKGITCDCDEHISFSKVIISGPYKSNIKTLTTGSTAATTDGSSSSNDDALQKVIKRIREVSLENPDIITAVDAFVREYEVVQDLGRTMAGLATQSEDADEKALDEKEEPKEEKEHIDDNENIPTIEKKE